MLGFVSKKKYDNLIAINKELGEALEKYANDNDRLNSELKNARKVSFELNEELLDYKQEKTNFMEVLNESKKEIKKLKTLCTKNGIDYSHIINKKEK